MNRNYEKCSKVPDLSFYSGKNIAKPRVCNLVVRRAFNVERKRKAAAFRF